MSTCCAGSRKWPNLRSLLRSTGYIAGRDLATVVFLSLRMGRPLFLEGEAGVGKTEIAKVISGESKPVEAVSALAQRPLRAEQD